MSQSRMIQCTCKICHQICAVEYTPNEFLTERFVRNAFICSRHGRNKPKPVVKPQASASLPYKDS